MAAGSECIRICNAVDAVGQWLFDWQTLIAGLIALAGAYWTVKQIREQVQQADAVRRDEIERRHRSARIALPLVLSSISELIDDIGVNVASSRERFDDKGVRKIESILEAPALPSRFHRVRLAEEVLRGFQTFVETLDSPSEIKHVHELMATLQILISRYNSFDLEAVGTAANLDDLLVWTGKTKLLTDVMFEYARKPDSRNFSLMHGISNEGIWDQIEGATQGLVFQRQSPDFFFPMISEIITRRKAAGISPWTSSD